MSIFRIALLQLNSSGADQAANLAIGTQACRRAHELGADLALFPEMWNIGYTFFDRSKPGAREAWQAQAITPESSFVHSFQQLARQLDMAIAITYLQEWQPAPRNAVSVIDRHGQICLTYAKIHTCDFDLEAALAPGEDFYVCSLDTRVGPVQLGAMICFDREFPESARVLMLKGAEIILTPNACDLELNRLGQFRARAYENMLGVAMANYAAPQINGNSAAFSPVAFTEEGASLDTCLVQAGEAEGIYLADFDMDAIRRWRLREVWGNAYRKPSRYDLLASGSIEPPFQRQDARR